MAEKKSPDGLSTQERDAVKQRAAEVRAQAKAGRSREAGTKALRDAIEALDTHDRALAEGLAGVVADIAPALVPKTYYGMPAWADEEGKVIVFIQPAAKFSVRYATIGFQDRAHLDDGDMWATSFAVRAWTPEVSRRISDLVRTAVKKDR